MDLKREQRRPGAGDRARSYRDTALQIYEDWQRHQLYSFPTVMAASTVFLANGHSNEAPSRPNTAKMKQQHNCSTFPRSILRTSANYKGTPMRPTSPSSIPPMDLVYVSERLIGLSFSPELDDDAYRSHAAQAMRMLAEKHGSKYQIFNLSPSRLEERHPHSMECGWPQGLAPPLEKLFSLSKALEEWLQEDPTNVGVLYCRYGSRRVCLSVAAFLEYSIVSASTPDQGAELDRFSMQRYLKEHTLSSPSPGEKRFLEYFTGILHGTLVVNGDPSVLSHLSIKGAPAFETAGGCFFFLKVQQGRVPLYTSNLYEIGPTKRSFRVCLPHSLALRGSVVLTGYHLNIPNTTSMQNVDPCDSVPSREVIFRIQFHTCSVSKDPLVFRRQELDVACDDLRFPLDGMVELHWVTDPPSEEVVTDDPEPLDVDVKWESVLRWDSFSDLAMANGNTVGDGELPPVDHTTGPLDGALYATITKRKSPASGDETSFSNQLDNLAVVTSPDCGGLTNGGVRTPSMDSGISSSGHNQQQKQQQSSSSSHNTSSATQQVTASSPNSEFKAAQEELDALLRDMLLDIQSIPDIKPGQQNRHAVVNGYGDVGSSSIPYHIRSDSKPFTYGGMNEPRGKTPPIHEGGRFRRSPSPPKRTTKEALSSPVLVRKVMGSETTTNSTPRHNHYATEPRTRQEIRSAPASSTTWLQCQQSKLRHRREQQLRSEREPQEWRLLTELRAAQRRKDDGDYLQLSRESSPAKLEGWYTPLHLQMPVFADDADDDLLIAGSPGSKGSSAPTSPLLPNRSSSRDRTYMYQQVVKRPVSRQQSDNSFDRERPFVAVRRAHEEARTRGEDSSQTLLASSPYGYTHYATPQRQPNNPGLLTTVDVHHPRNHNDSFNSTWSSSWRDTPDGSGSPAGAPTPSFPNPPQTPYINQEGTGLPPRSPTSTRRAFGNKGPPLRKWGSASSVSSRERSPSPQPQRGVLITADGVVHSPSISPAPSPSFYTGHSRRSSLHSTSLPEFVDVSAADVKFARDVSKLWYRPQLTREEAISLLRPQPPGAFVVRDSNSFPGAFGLALKVATLPAHAASRSNGADEFVRHFLIEPSPKGVRVKGCANEPVFSSLSALVYQHSVSPLAFPCKLLLPQIDPITTHISIADTRATTAQQLLHQGAACAVVFLFTMDMEALTGPQAIRRAVNQLLTCHPLPPGTAVHFKVSGQGITLTDNHRKLFFRRHYPVTSISYCGLDPEERCWSHHGDDGNQPLMNSKMFGFVARKQASTRDNQCHLFAELEVGQPAAAIVNFVTKVMMSSNPHKGSVV